MDPSYYDAQKNLYKLSPSSLPTTFQLADGTAANPSLKFILDPDTGLYRPSANTLGITCGGVQSATISSTGLKVPQGSFVVPSYSFLNDANSGFCSNGTGQINVVCNNFVVSQFGANQVRSQPGTVVAPFYSFALDTTSGMYLIDLEKIGFSTASTERLRITNTETQFSNQAVFLTGSAATPSITFGDANTGLYASAADNLDFTTNGTRRLGLNTSLTFYNSTTILNTLGAVATPSYSFSGDPDTGIYSSSANNLDLACNGTRSLNINSSNVQFRSGTSTQPSITFLSNPATGFANSATGFINFISNSAEVATLKDINFSLYVPIIAANGSASAPSLAFANSFSTGIYASAANNIDMATNGTRRLGLNTSLTFYNSTTLLNTLGSAAAPSYSFSGDTNTGIYSPSADILEIATGGVGRWQVNSAGHFTPLSTNTYDIGTSTNIAKDVYASRVILPFGGSDLAPSLTFSGDTNTGIYNVGGDFLGFSTGGALRLQISTTNAQFTTRIQGQAESATTPTFSFTSDTNTGIYSSGADSISISTGGTARVTVNTTNLISDLSVLGPNGTAGAPSFTFNGSSNTGIYRPSAGIIGFSCTSSLIGQFSPNGLFLIDGTQANPSYTFLGDTNTGLYSYSADQIGVACGGTLVGRFFNAGFIMNGNIFTNLTPSGGTLHWYLRTNGSVLRNAIGMAATESGSDTGSNLAFWNYTDAGAFKAQIYENERSTNNNYYWGRLWVGQTGSTTIPSIGFLNQSSCGLSSFYSSQIEFITSSVHRFSITNNSILPALDASYNLGSSGLRMNTIYASVGTINTSDRNLKENITDCPLGLDFVNKLKPVKYKWKNRTYEEKYYDQESKEEKVRTVEKVHSRFHMGLIAQDVKETLNELNIPTEQFAGYVDSSINEPGINTLGLNYTQFIAPMIKAIQEMSQKIIDLQEQINNLIEN